MTDATEPLLVDVRLGRWLWTGLSAITFMLLLARVSSFALPAHRGLSGPVVMGCVAAGLLYIGAHLLRAFRLAIIAMPLLGASFRTIVLLHLFVAPWSLIMPFKIDEIIRFGELARTSKSWTRSMMVLLIDRSMDGAILIAMALSLIASGRASVAGPAALVGVGLSLLVISIYVLPTLLDQVQRHVFVHHYEDRALRVLIVISRVRAALEVSRRTINSTAVFLVLTTLGIWCLELAAVALLLLLFDTSSASLLGVVETTLRRVDRSWQVVLAGHQLSSTVALLTMVFLTALLIVWVWVPIPYLRRQVAEPRRLRLSGTVGGLVDSTSATQA